MDTHYIDTTSDAQYYIQYSLLYLEIRAKKTNEIKCNTE